VTPVTIDGAVGAGEWADAYKQDLPGTARTFIFIKHDSECLYILLDMTNDTTQNHIDISYLFFDIGNRTIWDTEWAEEQAFQIYWNEDLGHYTMDHLIGEHEVCCKFDSNLHPGLAGAGGFGTSPDGPTNHNIFEYEIPFYMLPPLTGAAGETVGLYVLTYDYESLVYTQWPPGATYPQTEADLATIGDLVLTANTFISHEVVWGGFTFYVYTLSNSTVSDFNFSQPAKQISFNVTGDSGTPGFCNVTIPKTLLRANETQSWTVLLDGNSISYTKAESETHTYLYFTYTHSTHHAQIIGAEVIQSLTPVFQRGMCYTPWTSNDLDLPSSDESLFRMSQLNVEYVALVVWGFQDNITSTRIYARYGAGWSTPTNSSVIHAINRIHELGMKVKLKVIVEMVEISPGNWRGLIPATPEWFESYGNFINFWAEFAEEHGADMFSVGSEFSSNDGDASSWRNIVSGVRARYSGPILYQATFDRYQSIEWWDVVDYAGIDAYFPLTGKDDPTLEELKAAWSAHANEIEAWQKTMSKPVIFSEIGYRSADGANKHPWLWGESPPLPVDLQEQVDCYEAAFQTFWNKSWFYGYYWWNWDPNPDAGGPDDNLFTPQNKPVEETIKHWYSMREPPGPKARFTYSPLVLNVNFTVTFNASSSLPGWNGTHVMPIVNYSWDFGDGNTTATSDPIITHKYTENDTYIVTLNVTDSQGLWNITSKNITILYAHDVAITGVTLSKTVVGQGYKCKINVTAENRGDFQETFTVTVYYQNATHTGTIGTPQTVTLNPRATTTLTFIWNTKLGVKRDRTIGYTIFANATVVPGETETGDNTYTDGTVKIVIPGNFNADEQVNVIDLGMLGVSWLTKVGDPLYRPNVDVSCDGEINVIDLGTLGVHWLEPE